MDGHASTGGACNPLVVADWLDGLGVPPTRDNDKFRAQQHGLFASPQYLGGRLLRWGVLGVAATPALLRTAMTNLGTAMAPVRDDDTDLVVELVFTLESAATKYLVYGKPQRAAIGYRNFALSYEDGLSAYTEKAVCEFLATDPRVYALTQQLASMGIGSSSGGLAFPFAFPFSFGAAAPGSAVITNGGNFPTFPTLTITAGGSGASGIRVLNVTTGKEWSITITLAAADTLTVDMQNGTVFLNGTASRDNLVNRPPSEWWALEPGANTVQFIATGAGSTLDVRWRDAWLL